MSRCPLLTVALGIKDDVEALGLKGNRKKKSIKLEDDEMVRCSVAVLT